MTSTPRATVPANLAGLRSDAKRCGGHDLIRAGDGDMGGGLLNSGEGGADDMEGGGLLNSGDGGADDMEGGGLLNSEGC